jgi:hypothetical protein
MKYFFIFIFTVLIHTSCQPRKRSIEDEWLGRSKSDLVAKFGYPEGIYTTGLRDPGPEGERRSEIPIVAIIYGDVSYGLNYREEIVEIAISDE